MVAFAVYAPPYQSQFYKQTNTNCSIHYVDDDDGDDNDAELHVLGCRLTCQGQTVTSVEAWFDVALRPQKP